MIGSLLDALASPDDFFADDFDEQPLWKPVLIVTISSILFTAPVLLTTRRTLQALEEVPEGAVTVGVAFNAVLFFLATFVVWLLVAAVIHGLSAVLGADRGSFYATLAVVGWGFLPAIIVYLLNGYVVWDTLQTVPRSASVEVLVAQLQSGTLFQVVTAVTVVTTVWQGIIWTYGTHSVRGVDLRQAAIAAGVPTLAYVGFTLYGLA